MRTLSPFLFFLLVAFAAQGQNILTDTVTWNSVRAVSQSDGSEAVYNCSFTSTGNQSIDWTQKGGARIYHYAVTEVDGAWPDLGIDGHISYKLSATNMTGQMTFARAAGVITLYLKTVYNGKQDINHVFYISSFQRGQ